MASLSVNRAVAVVSKFSLGHCSNKKLQTYRKEQQLVSLALDNSSIQAGSQTSGQLHVFRLRKFRSLISVSLSIQSLYSTATVQNSLNSIPKSLK